MSDPIIRAAHAKRLMDDPVLVEAFENVRAEALQAWEGTGSAQVEQREVAWLTVKIINRIEIELKKMVDGGKIEAKRIQAPFR